MNIYYKALGTDGKDRYKLGFTSSPAAFTKEYVKNGWKAKDLLFIPMKKGKQFLGYPLINGDEACKVTSKTTT